VNQLPQGWKIKRLDELCDIARGGSPRPIKQFLTDDPDGVNWIKIGDATASSKYIYNTQQKIKPEGIKRSRLVKEGDFLLSNSMSFGRPYIMKTTGCIHDGWLVLRDKSSGQFNQDFLYHFLSSAAAFKKFDNLAAGSTVRNLNINLVSGVQVLLPPLPEQKRIVAILDEAFSGIDQAVANAEKNLANARELFENYLTRIFTCRDEGWVETTLGELCHKVEYGTSSKSKSQGSVPVLRMGNIQNGAFIWDDLVYSDNADDIKKYKLKYNDVLFNRTNSAELVGKSAIYKGEREAIFAGYLIRIHRKENLIDAEFLNYYLNSSRAKEYGKTVMSRSINQANINGTKLKKYPISTPELDVQKRLVEEIHNLEIKIHHLTSIYHRKLSALTELKQSILQKAFIGELTANTVQ
jgi:type I restriction enzyme S subunit